MIRAAVLTAPGKLEIRQFPESPPPRDGAVLRVTHSAEQYARTVEPSMITCGVRTSSGPPHCGQRRSFADVFSSSIASP